MIRLVFTYQHEVIFFTIHNKKIIYHDRKFPVGINFIPKDLNFMRTIIMSRNRIASEMIKWINDANSGKNLEEWESCKDDYEVAEIIKKDSKLKGCVFRKMFTEEELTAQGINYPQDFKNLPTEAATEVTEEAATEVTEEAATEVTEEQISEEVLEGEH
jgi:hypothetical protein